MTDAPAENQPDPDPAADDSDAGRSTPTPRPDPPLRPVDWDGSASRVWNSRATDQRMDEVARRQEAEWGQESLDRMKRELIDKLLAESEPAGRAAEAGEQREPEPPTDARPAGGGGTGEQSLFDRLENFGRSTDEEDSPSRDDGSGYPR